MDLFYPELSVQIGGYTFTHGVSVVVCSARDAAYDWAKVQFTPEFLEEVSLAKGSRACISMGYGDQLLPVFVGSVAQDFVLSDGVNEVLLQDDTCKLAQTRVDQVFTGCTPQEIVTYCCGLAKVTDVRLTPQQYAQRPSVPILGHTALSAIAMVARVWGIQADAYFMGGRFYWGIAPEQLEMYHLEYGVNIIRLGKAAGRWEIESVSLPFIRHSQRIRITHPLLSGDFEIYKTVYRSDADGFIRSYIYI